jgi:hypothetical protein
MSNGANSLVTEVHQRNDNTVEIHVKTGSFRPGQEVELSGYLIQGSRAYADFTVKKHIPLDAGPSAVLDVQLPAMDLKKDERVTVVTRVAEIWPTILAEDTDAPYIGKGLKAVWKAEYPSGK